VRLPTRTGLALAAAATLVALPTVASGAPAGSAAPAAPAANSVTFQDSTGENPDAPDITTLVVSNNDAGIITFRVNIPNRPTFTRDLLLWLFVNTDNSPATGDPEFLGADYVLQLFEGEATLFRWDGSDFTRRPGDPASTSLLFSYQAGATIQISAAELGNTKRFGFAAVAISGIGFDEETGDLDFTNAVGDIAPAAGSGLYDFPVIIAKPTLNVRRVVSTPAKAGRPITMRMTVARSDTGATIKNGRVTCQGRAAGRALRATTARVQAGAVVCTWQLPANSKGKSFTGRATVVFEGLRATGTVTKRIG
jgi:hypothetical protein